MFEGLRAEGPFKSFCIMSLSVFVTEYSLTLSQEFGSPEMSVIRIDLCGPTSSDRPQFDYINDLDKNDLVF